MQRGLYDTVVIVPAVIPRIGPIGFIGPVCLPWAIPAEQKNKEAVWMVSQQIQSGKRLRYIAMSEIYLIRHGQASFGEDNYDRLSPLGVRQAQCLARHLARTGKSFDAVYCGEMERQQNTAREFFKHYSSKGLAVTRPTVSKAFNEYDSFAVWQALIPGMLEDDPSIANELKKLPGDQKAFQGIFGPLMTRWISGNYHADNIPRWDDFTRRVQQGVEELMARHVGKKRLVVFTSGGPISVALQIALGLPDKKALEISWQLLNASITRIKYSHRGMMLAGFNEVAHLELEGEEGLISYR